jgi:cobalt/nickel transport system ATP-binding protein
MEMLDELNVYGKTVIISTHDVELAYRWADHVVLMNGGAVLREGPPESVFSDGPSIKKARLKRPMLLDLREELVGRGIMDEENELPKSILDMVDMIHRTVGSITKVSTGRIFLYPIDEGDPSELSALLEGDQVSFIGAMGTKAKIMAGKHDLKLDFSYGVIDKCILKAITGRNSLIMTSGGMVDHTVGRIREYGGELGVELKIMRPAGKDGATTDDPATKPQH